MGSLGAIIGLRDDRHPSRSDWRRMYWFYHPFSPADLPEWVLTYLNKPSLLLESRMCRDRHEAAATKTLPAVSGRTAAPVIGVVDRTSLAFKHSMPPHQPGWGFALMLGEQIGQSIQERATEEFHEKLRCYVASLYPDDFDPFAESNELETKNAETHNRP